MRSWRFVLLGDGPSDQALRRPIEWAIRQRLPKLEAAPLEFLPRRPPGQKLADAIALAAEHYRPDLLFVHRDAEGVAREERLKEIPTSNNVVRVVPVRMTEAWFLISADAIRRASGNPRGRVPLDLPRPTALERLADPKSKLRELLVAASEATGRRRRLLERHATLERVADAIDDYSTLRTLVAFAAFETELEVALATLMGRG